VPCNACQIHPDVLCCAGKEYSKADSRYATRDDFVISMEAVTAFLEGPGCLLICWAMLNAKPWRFTAILLVSLGQLYGDVLYFGTCFHGGERGFVSAEDAKGLPLVGCDGAAGRQLGNSNVDSFESSSGRVAMR
jgi:hypothetical protein